MTDEQKLVEIWNLAFEYADIDGAHHKQFALVEILKIVDEKMFKRYGKDIEPGIEEKF